MTMSNQVTTRFEPWPGTDWPPRRHIIPPWIWQLAVAAALIGALLLAFHRVVQGAVAEGELRRQQDAVLAMESWRCNTMGNRRLSADCLRQLARAAGNGVRDTADPQLAALD